MNKRQLAIIIIASVMQLAFFNFNVQAEPSPIALLKGVRQARMKYDDMQFSFTTEYLKGDVYSYLNSLTVSSLVDISKGKCRFEEFKDPANPGFAPGVVTLLTDGEVYAYERRKWNSVDYYDADMARARGDHIYDPRIIGLASILNVTHTLEDCLALKNELSATLIGQEQIDGVSVWHVRSSNEQVTYDFWIEEPTFRVYKKDTNLANGTLKVSIDCEYDADNDTPFPSTVRIKRFENGKQDYNRVVRDVKTTVKKSIPEDRFALTSMDIPINTTVVDYRIDKSLGYWDGEKLVEDPVKISAQERRDEEVKAIPNHCQKLSDGT